MSITLAALMACGIAIPHVLPLRSAPPATAIALWIASLLLRAVASVFAVLYLVLFLPQTQLFNAITHWCWHTVLPLVATHLGLDGHEIGDTAVVLPAVVLLASGLSVGFGVMSAARSLRRLLRRHALGSGPEDSVIVGGSDVLLAAAGLVHPRIVVSAGALTVLDDEELAAGLAHERGHIARRHRYLLVLGAFSRATGCFVPGGRRALTALGFHLERDADRFALRRHDRLALASAICKAATPQQFNFAYSGLGGSGVTERLRQLLDDQTHAHRKPLAAVLSGLAVAMIVLGLASAAVLPATAYAGAEQVGQTDAIRHCRT